MGLLNQLRAKVGGIARIKIRRQAMQQLATIKDCQTTQQTVFENLLRLNADSEYARDHKFHEIRTVQDFRDRIPVSNYDHFQPYIEKMKMGDHGALLGADNKLLMFSLSSGTTGRTKFIPITEQFLSDYRRGWQSWGILCFDDHYPVNWKNIVQLTSDYDRFRTPGSTPCGNISGLVVEMQKKIVRLMYSLPKIIAKIRDPEAKYYASLRTGVADHKVGMMTTANPSTLIHLARLSDEVKESLIRDIHDGTMSKEYDIADEIRQEMHRCISRKRKTRARELDRIVNETGHLYPKDYWPGLEVLAVWSGGSAGAYLRTLREFYGKAPIRDHGLHASEGRMTIPLEDGTPAGVLETGTHFFEFIPESEYDSENPVVLQAHELEAGQSYYILLTTSSGLCRYDIADVVYCSGFYGTSPILEFLHKGAYISNITGEKVSESQVVAAVRTALEEFRLQPKHFTVSPVWDDPPQYQLLIEQGDVPTKEAGDKLAHVVDEELKHLNCEYREKRETLRLQPMSCVTIPDGTWERFAHARQQSVGGSSEQYKHPCLVPDLEFTEKLLDAQPSASGTTRIDDASQVEPARKVAKSSKARSA